ncbi:hypothetical protein CFP56_007203 [Quercus suber]|uniref:Uncharacterized protein n=1 Tax=Quercus suber TaxID=58331 RepID=A0AAW0L897_QUESU
MARMVQNENKAAGAFFFATLMLWLLSLSFEIVFNKRNELLCVIAGCCFFQTANWVIRFRFSKDPLFVNTSVSLLHSSIISSSVVFILVNQWLKKGSNGIYLGGLGRGHIQLYASHAVTLHMINGICCITGYTMLHSIFLHVRKVRRMAGLRDANSTIVRAEWVLNWVAFIFARFVSHVLITVRLLRDRHKFGKGIELPLALFGMVGMNLLNVFLGIDLFHAFKREISSQPNSHHHRE